MRQVGVVAVPAALCESQVAPAAALLSPELCSLCAFTSLGAKVGRLGQQPPLPLLWHPETSAEVAASKELMPPQPGLENVLWSICQGVACGLCACPCPCSSFQCCQIWSTGSELAPAAARCDPVGICRAQRLALLDGDCRESGSAGRRLCSCQGCPFLLHAGLQAQNPSQWDSTAPSALQMETQTT